MVTHYLSDRTTKCGLIEIIKPGDDYSTDYEDCNCPDCNLLILHDVAKKLNASIKPMEVAIPLI